MIMGVFLQTLSHEQGIELACIFIAVVMLWFGNSKRLIRHFSLLSRIRFLGVLLFLLSLFGLLFTKKLNAFEFFMPADQIIKINLYLYECILFILFIALLFVLKSIVFHQQTQYTMTVFRLLLIAVLLKLFGSFGLPLSVDYTVSPFFEPGIAFDFLFGFIIVLFYFIGFRCKWIHLLNKNQKFSTFFWGLVLCIFSFPVLWRLIQGMQNHSLIMSQFLGSIMQVIIIYSILCLLSLMLFLPSAGFLDKKTKELKILQQLSNTLSTILDEEKLFNEAVKLCSHMVEAQYVWLEKRLQSDTFILQSVYGIQDNEIRGLPNSCVQKMRQMILNQETTLFIQDLSVDRVLKSIRKWLPKGGALLGTKIGTAHAPEYLLYAVHRNRFGFTDNHVRLLQMLGEQISGALDNSRLLSQTIEQQVYKEELKMAHEAQMRLLPKTFPELPGARINGFCSTANDIGGDFYDVIPINEDRIDIIIGDVSGKGADAAFYMAELKGMIQPLAMHHPYPKEILVELNQILYMHFEA